MAAVSAPSNSAVVVANNNAAAQNNVRTINIDASNGATIDLPNGDKIRIMPQMQRDEPVQKQTSALFRCICCEQTKVQGKDPDCLFCRVTCCFDCFISSSIFWYCDGCCWGKR